MNQKTARLLYKLYTTPGLSTTFGSKSHLFKAAKLRDPRITLHEVEQWLNTMDAYTLHRLPRRKNQPRVEKSGIDEQWSADLCDMSNIAEYNDNMKFMLTVIDCFSKRADGEPVEDKSASKVATAFEKILDRSEARKPQLLETDRGKEFWNEKVRGVCARHNIRHFSSYSVNKASTVERFNRTLKSLLYRYFTHNNTYRWIEVLPEVLQSYNNRWHRSIKMAPNEVNNTNEKMVRRNLYSKATKQEKTLREGDLVRISKARRTFHHGYLPTFTEELFRICHVLQTKPKRYKLEDMMGEKLLGSFSKDELQKVIKGAKDLWKIEKILKTRKRHNVKEHLIRWRGFPEKFDSWIPDKDIIRNG